MSQSEIEWTDWTWNVITGCDRVSAGCDHCYALTLAKRLKAMGNPRYQTDGSPKTSGPGFGVTLHPDKLTDPLRWTSPKRVFVNSMSDLFHADVPTDFIDRVWATMLLADQHTFQILTKRPQRMYRYVSDPELYQRVLDQVNAIRARWHSLQLYQVPVSDPTKHPARHIWLGTSVENQEAAYRIDWLVKTPAAVRFLSCEPLLGDLDLRRWLWRQGVDTSGELPGQVIEGQIEPRVIRAIDWVITGGESGPGFRPLDLDWVRDIRDQCQDAGVAFFHKQNGGIRSKAGGRELDGRVWDEMPAVAS